MADENKTQTYVWPVELRENKITERTDDYTASVKTFSDTKSLEYIAKEIVRERTEYREDTILSIMKLVEEKIRHVLYSGYPVMTENVRFSPTITGSFDSHGEVLDDKGMKCGVNVTVNQIVKDGLAGVKLYIDSVQELGGAKIDRVKDLTTGRPTEPSHRAAWWKLPVRKSNASTRMVAVSAISACIMRANRPKK